MRCPVQQAQPLPTASGPSDACCFPLPAPKSFYFGADPSPGSKPSPPIAYIGKQRKDSYENTLTLPDVVEVGVLVKLGDLIDGSLVKAHKQANTLVSTDDVSNHFQP